MSSKGNYALGKHKSYSVPKIGITVSVAGLLFFTLIMPMLLTGFMIENGQLLPGENHYLALPIILIFLLVPLARFVSNVVFGRYIAVLNQFCEEIRIGNYNVSFSLPNQKEDEDEYTILLRNLAWMSHNLNIRQKDNTQKIKKSSTRHQ